MEKMTRERTVRERRAKKLEKKQAARMAKAAGGVLPEPAVGDEIPITESSGPAEISGPVA